jgi:GxxExxY protein
MRIKGNLLYEKKSYKIRGACFAVYNSLGGGIKEKIVHRALYNEFSSLGFDIKREAKIDIYYKDKKIGTYIPDFLIDDKIIIEIKSKPFISKEDLKQFWGYLKGSKYQLGFLLGFTPQRLIIKRLIHTNKKPLSV